MERLPASLGTRVVRADLEKAMLMAIHTEAETNALQNKDCFHILSQVFLGPYAGAVCNLGA